LTITSNNERKEPVPTLSIEKLSNSVGAVVTGVDKRTLLDDEYLPQWTLEMLEAHGALVFRGLHLNDDAQVAFSRKLGTVEKFGREKREEIFRISLDPKVNAAAAYLQGTFFWHIDGCMEDIPIMATMLTAHQVAASGGETEFASTYQAYEDLSDREKAALEKIRVVHTIEATMRMHTPEPSPEQVEVWRKKPAKVHPLVWTHRSGRKSLVLGATTDHVVGWGAEESRRFLDDLLDRATSADRVYRHDWEVGDLVLWDNRGVLHRAAPYDPSSPRDMHRTTFIGDEPIA
jgi:alpha-ketoglutarate-dependent taurine dioxygenase